MAKKKRTKNKKQQQLETVELAAKSQDGSLHALRETVESIVIAFVLAFLFRTFEAEAFVIPTGSMSPSLQGQHKDVDCSACGFRFRTTASDESDENRLKLIQNHRNPHEVDIMAGACPMCRQPVLYRSDGLPRGVAPAFEDNIVDSAPSYPGDRILVNKYIYNSQEPERWDVVVFKFPGNGEMNYIKRLVGLSNETLRVFQGDVFVKPNEPGAEFQIERKPADKVLAMLQDVHDTAHDPSVLYEAGWPLRWSNSPGAGWEIEAEPQENIVQQKFVFDSEEESELNWIRYQHLVPSTDDWNMVRKLEVSPDKAKKSAWLESIEPELITDLNPYNIRIQRRQIDFGDWEFAPHQFGTEWVSDLAVECEVDLESANGKLVLDLVEAGKHFSAHFDLSSGQVRLQVEGNSAYSPTAQTSMKSTGSYKLLFANVDDQLLLWVNGDLVEFESTAFDFGKLVNDRSNMVPVTSESDLGDLAPAGVGASGTKLTVRRLKVMRDIYYIATKWNDPKFESSLSGHPYSVDYDGGKDLFRRFDGRQSQEIRDLRDLFRNPERWSVFATRQKSDFEIKEDQLFVMGDNSPESLDCRLWNVMHNGGKPGGPYLDKELLIGKAVCVFWPHSWGTFFGIKALPGFPGVSDMRLVR